jgi:hypothetical protein
VSFRVLKVIQECPADRDQYKRSHYRSKQGEAQCVETSSRPFRIENSAGDRSEDTDGNACSGRSVESQRSKPTLFIASCRFEIHPPKPYFSETYIWRLSARKTAATEHLIACTSIASNTDHRYDRHTQPRAAFHRRQPGAEACHA